MNIVLEGPDGGGKSTLATFLAARLRYRVHASEGPIRDDAEMKRRFLIYLLKRRTIFDRLAMISEPIYGPVFQRRFPTPTDMAIIAEFYETKPLIIYCRGDALDQHTASSPVDTPAYLAQLRIHHPRICAKYDAWAKAAQPMRYEIGDDMNHLLQRIEGKIHAFAV